MRINWDPGKNELLNRTRGIGFEDAVELFGRPYVVQTKNEIPNNIKLLVLQEAEV